MALRGRRALLPRGGTPLNPLDALRARVSVALRFRELRKDADAEPEHTTAMVALLLPPDVAEALALPNGIDPAEFHLTLAFLGQAADLDDPALVVETVRVAAAFCSPLAGAYNGLGRFCGVEDGADAFVALADVPHLSGFRHRLVERLEEIGAPVSHNHGFTAHTTLAYIEPGEAVPLQRRDPVAVAFSEVGVYVAGRVWRFPLGRTSFVDLYDAAYASAGRKRATATVRKDAGDDGSDSTIKDARTRKVDAFAALLVGLFGELQRGQLTETVYLERVGSAFDAAVGDVPDAAAATMKRLRDKAVERARGYVEAARLPADHDDAPSDAAKVNWGNIVAGALWAATFAAVAYRQQEESSAPLEDRLDAAKSKAEDASGDELDELRSQIDDLQAQIEEVATNVFTWRSQRDTHVCASCDELDGQTFFLEEIEFWPGEGDFGENTDCGPECRCSLRGRSEDDEEEAA